MASNDELKKLQNLIAEDKYSAGSMAKRFGTKSGVTEKAIAALELLNQHRPDIKDKEAFDLWSSARDRLTNQLKAAKEYAPTLPATAAASNLDELNSKGYLKVAAKDPAGKILEKEASKLDPRLFREQQSIQKTIAPNINELQKLDIAGAKRKALQEMAGAGENSALKLAAKSASKMGGAMGHMKGMGKIAALGALIGTAGKAMAGEPIDMKGLAGDAATAFTPPAIDAAFGSLATEQELSPEQIAQYQAEMKQKSDEARRKQEETQSNALEFGDKLNDMQSKDKRQLYSDMLSKK